MKLGSIEIPEGGILAPMAGISCVPFRRLCLEMGAALAVTELVSGDALLRHTLRHQERIERAPRERILVGQILGRTPEQIGEAARTLEEEGVDAVDLNFGCPARKVVAHGGGSAFLKEPARIGEAVRAAVASVKVPVSVKLRAGFDLGRPVAVEAAQYAAGEGAAAIFVHGRYREQIHSGPVHLEVIAAVKQAVAVPVIGNGGIRTLKDANRMKAETGCDAVMIGQGATTNPWIFGEILAGRSSSRSAEECIAAVTKLLGYYLEWAGPRRASVEMRKFAAWMVRGLPGAVSFRRRLGEATSPEALLELLRIVEQPTIVE